MFMCLEEHDPQVAVIMHYEEQLEIMKSSVTQKLQRPEEVNSI